MSDSDKQSTPSSDELIRPAQVSLNVGPAAPSSGRAQSSSVWYEHRFLLFGIGLGAVLLLAVIFVLPNKVSLDVEQTASDAAESSAPRPQGPSESPFRDQQFGKERRQAQEILAKILAKQQQLELIKVWEWAEQDYAEAKSYAEQADIDYRQQEFIKAQDGYNQTLTAFNALLARAKTLYTDSMAQGEQAILDTDDKLAIEQFTLAATLVPNDAAAAKGLQRAKVLADVITKVTDGKELQRQGKLQEAKQLYQAALGLDAESIIAQQQIDAVNIAIRDRNFGEQMSIGYAAINNQQYPKAIQAFQQATAIKPNADDAQTALVQAQNEYTLAQIAEHMQAAESFEQQEQWQQALDEYNAALALDSAVVAAKVGAIRTDARAKIDQTLEDIINNPQRLTTASVYRDFQDYLARTKAMPDKGPRLQRQAEQLEQALIKAVQPVPVRFQSDNLTRVTLYRIGELGLFAQKELTLKPGNYTAVGKRNGYRDVLREFTVSLDAQQQAITIQCEEKIPTG